MKIIIRISSSFLSIQSSMKKRCQYIALLLVFLLVKSVAQVPELCVPSTHEAYEFAFSNDDKMMFSLAKNELKVWLTEGPFLLKTIPIMGTDSMERTLSQPYFQFIFSQ